MFVGTKSAFSYTNTFYYTCRKDGKERKYLMYKSDSGFTIDLLFEKDSTEKTGVTVTIPLRGYDLYNFRTKIKNQLCYFDNVFFKVDGEDYNRDFKIFREKDFHWSTLYGDRTIHITLGKVNYPIDWNAVGMSRIDIPIGLRFELDSGLFPIPNRENLIWNDETKKLVKDKIKKVGTWFVNKYNSEIKELPTLFQAWDFINPPKRTVTIEDKVIDIDLLQQVAVPNLTLNEVKIKGIEHISPKRYKSKVKDLLKDFKVVAVKRNKKMQSKGFYEDLTSLVHRKAVVLADDVIISGYFREYLKETEYDIYQKSSQFKSGRFGLLQAITISRQEQ
jgi:hypothetical protein